MSGSSWLIGFPLVSSGFQTDISNSSPGSCFFLSKKHMTPFCVLLKLKNIDPKVRTKRLIRIWRRWSRDEKMDPIGCVGIFLPEHWINHCNIFIIILCFIFLLFAYFIFLFLISFRFPIFNFEEIIRVIILACTSLIMIFIVVSRREPVSAFSMLLDYP